EGGEIEEADEAASVHRRRRADDRRRNRDEVHGGRTGRTQDRDRRESAAGEADGDRVERNGAGGVDRWRAVAGERGSERAGGDESEIAGTARRAGWHSLSHVRSSKSY